MNDFNIHRLSPVALRDMDVLHVEKFNTRLEQRISQAESKIYKSTNARDKALAKFRSWTLRSDLPPIAMDGHEGARVIYLQGNPSHGEHATPQSHFQPHPEWPLSVANPNIDPDTAKHYRKVFMHLERTGITRAQIARNFMKVELCPWASKSWPSGLEEDLSRFPSRAIIKEYVQHLADRGSLFIIKSNEQIWFDTMPALEELLGKQVFVSMWPRLLWINHTLYPQGWLKLLAALKG